MLDESRSASVYSEAKPRPVWLEDALLAVQLPESPLLQKFRGGQRLGFEDEFSACLSDSWLESLVRAGVKLVVFPYYSGFGAEFEKAHLERMRDFIGCARVLGLKTAARVTLGAVTIETLLLEEPDAQNWMQVNADGRTVPVRAGRWLDERDVFRTRPCYNSEAFLRYMEKVCVQAVDSGVDTVCFEEAAYSPEPDACRCPVCVGAFREMLRQQYGAQEEHARQAGQERFGHNHFTHARPPSIQREKDIRSGRVSSPQEQEWIKFKVQTLSLCLARLARAVARRNPQCAVGADLFTTFGTNADSLHGINFLKQIPHVDVLALEGPQLQETVAIGQRVAQSFGAAVLTFAEEHDPQSCLGLNLLYNSKGYGGVVLGAATRKWVAPGWERAQDGDAALKTFRAYCDFFARHKTTLLQGSRPLTAVAVYQDTPSRAFHSEEQQIYAVESHLIRNNVSIELLFSNQLAGISKHRCVVLPDCECLSDELGAVFEKYVRSGGGLILTGNTGQRDAWGRVRAQPLFASQQSAAPEMGRVFHVQVLPSGEKLAMLLRDACGGDLPWSVTADSGRILAECTQTRSGAIAFHVLNTSYEPAHGIHVSIACEKQPQAIHPLSPFEQPDPPALNWENGRLHFTCPEVKGYVLFSIEF